MNATRHIVYKLGILRVILLNIAPCSSLMAFAPSPSSVNSNFSLSDSVVTLDMSDDSKLPRGEDFVFEKEGSLNSSMITVIVSLQSMLAVRCFTDILFYRLMTSTFVSILTSSKENRRHLRPSFPRPRPTQSACKMLPPPSSGPCGGSSTKGKSPHAALINAPLIQATLQGCMTTTNPPLPSGWIFSP
jgi:hypothetical protein